MKKAILAVFLILNLFYITNYLFRYARPFNILGTFWLVDFVIGILLSVTVLFSFHRHSSGSLFLAIVF
ncbi:MULTISPECIES: hypothetical protein [unclassified Bacillus (in: firmicutes)]|uniref:hypothetical protein n=1 Tax=unclassified Bacillus (in: firmicutes) TaxID=185979 RepID=UPI000400564F|nr:MULTISPECIES: hypothetical protein [unclassified Bacillus (in: firmicutes)]QHZ45831.1 hypothetical protein M654_005620 [Bacillus sp. NSP9.1]WFA04304.1 hypothetical protein P3X63_17105 [Bacillus sp. HSf4]